ncbi:MAG TPA: rhomboid family intramembrane serine protease [Puia sp.]|nr:rhomboid family intramembrane serine protease [Puia sp.]
MQEPAPGFEQGSDTDQGSGPEPASEAMPEKEPSIQAMKTPSFVSMRASSHLITFALVGVNVLIFILMGVSGVNLFEPDTQSLLKWGANYRPLSLEGEWWRLLTACFIHAGALHLLLNISGLLYIGLLLEPLLGRARYLMAYLLTGIIASLTSLAWHNVTVGVGASGAILGLFGVFLSMLISRLVEDAARKPLLISIATFVGLNLLFGMGGNIDNAAHVGGLISGLILGFAYYPALKTPGSARLRYRTLILPSAATLIIVVIGGLRIPDDIGTYEKKMKQFALLESKAQESLSAFKDFPRGAHRNSIEATGLECWDKNIKLLSEMKGLKLPFAVLPRIDVLSHYCALRKKYAVLVYKAIDEDTARYNDEISKCNEEIGAVLGELKE